MADSQSLHDELEKKIALLLLDKLEHSKINLERASQIARFVLKTLPDGMTDEQVQEIIPKLDDEFFELCEIVDKHIHEYEEKNKLVVLHDVKELIKKGQLEEADKLMKNYFLKITNDKVAKPTL